MPEAPEMEVVKDYLTQNLVGNEVSEAHVLKPSVLRSLRGDIHDDKIGWTFTKSTRHGKFPFLELSGDRAIVINQKLAGGLQFCPPKQRVLKRTCILLDLSGGSQLRYTDDRRMGMFYYVSNHQLNEVPGLDDIDLEVSSFDSKGSAEISRAFSLAVVWCQVLGA